MMRLAVPTLRALLPVVLAGALLRALVPAGYMPASVGSGLLFELCHDGMPVEFMAALAGEAGSGHAHGHHHGPHDHSAEDHAAGTSTAMGSCSIGHLLSMVALDDAIPDAEAAALDPLHYRHREVGFIRADLRYALAARGPPVS